MAFQVLKGKVTTATSSAVGTVEQTALLITATKKKVNIADFNEEKGLDVISQIKEGGGEVTFVKINVSKSEDV